MYIILSYLSEEAIKMRWKVSDYKICKKGLWILAILLQLFMTRTQAQTQENGIDTLEQRLLGVKADTQKIHILYKMVGWYQNQDPKKALSYARQGLAISLRNKRDKDACDFLGYIGGTYTIMGDFPAASAPFDQEYELATRTKDRRHVAVVQSGRGLVAEMQ